MEVLLVALILLAVVAFVTVPLRRPARAERTEDPSDDPRIVELEARKEAKYREIRDAELDRASGKLSEDDWRRQDGELRAEAIEILRELDRTRGDSDGGRS